MSFDDFCSMDLTADINPENSMWLELLELANIFQVPDNYRGREPLTGKIVMGKVEYKHGIQMNESAEMLIQLDGCAESFHAVVGVDDSSQWGKVQFEVWVDGDLIEQTPMLTREPGPVRIDVQLKHAATLELVVKGSMFHPHGRHANWGGAILRLNPDSKAKPKTVAIEDKTMPIVMGQDVQPSINYPRITGATPGRDFLFRIPASGEGPLSFTAENLPSGLSIAPDTGIISGKLEAYGEWDVTITATNKHGSDTQVLKIVGGHRKLALTPPMGWNSWNVYAGKITQENVKENAEAMVNSGLAAHGYQYINIDDFWMGERDKDGKIQCRDYFPDMKACVDHVHSLGLKAGIYSSPGPKTCGGCEGSYNHELNDAESWAAWGFDFLKHDLCSYERKIPNPDHRGMHQRPYLVMRAALDATDRDIVYSLCQYGLADVHEWGRKVGAQLWRTTYDIVDAWESVKNLGFSQARVSEYAGPGAWNDPDMLVVGKVGWGHKLTDCNLTRNEQITHITLWSLLAAPLLIGCDMSDLDDFTFALLTNDEVLGVNQDPLGKQARQVYEKDERQVWARPLSDGSTAIGLFNLHRRPQKVGIDWDALGLAGAQKVRNLWTHEDLGAYDTCFEEEIPRHGAMMLRVQK